MDRPNAHDAYLLERPWSALLFDTLEHYEIAIAKLTAFLENNPTHAPAHNNRAIAYWEVGQLDDAAGDLALAARYSKNDPLPFKHWGMVLQQQGQREEAIQRFLQGLEIAPHDAALLVTLAHALRGSSDSKNRSNICQGPSPPTPDSGKPTSTARKFTKNWAIHV